jgi:uncharacterized protein
MSFQNYSKPKALYRKDKKILKQCYVASTFFQKTKGLLGSQKINNSEGLLIPHCKSVHTFFMNYPIDLCFLNRKLKVVYVIHKMKPWRLTGLKWKAFYTLEAQAGWNQKHHIRVGDTLHWG